MNAYTLRSRGLFAGLLLTLLGASVLATAGTRALSATTERDPILVAVVEHFPRTTFPGAPQADARAMVVREPGRPDLLVLHPAHLEPAALAAALSSRNRSVQTTPRPTRGLVVRITGYVAREQPRRGRYEVVLRDLQRQPVSRIGNLGPGRWIEVDARSLAH